MQHVQPADVVSLGPCPVLDVRACVHIRVCVCVCVSQVGLAYYGPAFNGWARQPNTVTHTDTNTDTHTTQQQSLPSVESALSQALYTLTGASKHVAVAGAGRTDKGVHALGQVCEGLS